MKVSSMPSEELLDKLINLTLSLENAYNNYIGKDLEKEAKENQELLSKIKEEILRRMK